MNKNLNLKIKESIETKQLSENLLLLCLAHLNESIEYSPLIVKRYIEQRVIIAKAALKHGITKESIKENIHTISKEDYPTFKSITKVADIIEKGNYTFVSDLIPTKGHIHFKSDDELKADLERKPVKKKVDIDSKELQEREYNEQLKKNESDELKLLQKKEDDTTLWFDNGRCINVKLIKQTIEERNIFEFDLENIKEVYKDYYEIAIDEIADKSIVDKWFKKHFNYTYEEA